MYVCMYTCLLSHNTLYIYMHNIHNIHIHVLTYHIIYTYVYLFMCTQRYAFGCAPLPGTPTNHALELWPGCFQRHKRCRRNSARSEGIFTSDPGEVTVFFFCFRVGYVLHVFYISVCILICNIYIYLFIYCVYMFHLY